MATVTRRKKTQTIFSGMVSGQFTAIFSAVIVALIISSLFYVNYTYQEVSREYSRMSENFAMRLQDQLEKPVQLLRMLDSALILENADQADYAKIGAMMDRINQTNRFFENIEVIDLDGEILSTFPQYDYLVRFDRSGEDFFRKSARWTTTHWSDLEVSEITQHPSLRVTIRSKNVMLSGTLKVDFIDEYCETFLAENENLGNIELMDRYGVYLFSTDPRKVEEHRVDSLFSLIDGGRDDHEFTGITYLDDQWQLVSSAHVVGSGWHITIKTPVVNAFRDALLILGGFSFFILLTIVVFGIIARNNAFIFSNHVNVLIGHTRSVSEGNYASVPEISKYSEFQELTRNFNRMLESIQTRDSQLQTIAFQDELTSLYNRNYLFSRLIPGLIAQPEAKFALMIIDIDNFNIINDTIGHEAGDGLLASISRRMVEYLPSDVHVLRLGGDEFALVVPLTEENTMDRIKSTLNRIQGTPFSCNLRDIFITMSIGVSYYPEQGDNLYTLMKNADIAMHHAKRNGRGNVKIFDQLMSEGVDRKLHVEQYLRTALENQEFHLVYQPQYAIDGKSLRGFEALLRWTHPVLGNVGPAEFIPLAEDAQLIVYIEAWVLNEASRAIKDINTMWKSNFIMAVNISPVEFLDLKFLHIVKEVCATTGFRPEWLELEITENVPMGMHDSVLAQIHSLKDIGVKISMDDFGTGYSSLSYLSRFPIDLLKIDRSFISGVDQSSEKQAMVKTIIALVNQLGIQSLAEGVETEGERSVLAAMSCDFVQGYLYSRPLELEKILPLIRTFKQNDDYSKEIL